MSSWNDPDLQKLFLKKTPLIDVRAPIEFAAGSIPYSVNLPLMSNEERHQIGICYKQDGQEAAIALGHKLVSGDVKAKRIEAWIQFLQNYPEAQVFCFRGGLRSQISCQWIGERGIERAPIPGGYKRLRQFFLSWLQDAPLPQLWRLGCLTGSGKTSLLIQCPHRIDLEALANHRGSAFGSRGEQPDQVTFENYLAVGLLKNPQHLIVEDESVSLGARIIPLRFFKQMRAAPLLILEVSLEQRVRNIFEEYVVPGQVGFFLNAVGLLSKRLGGLRSNQMTEEIKSAWGKGLHLEDHVGWITTLLVNYYDPLYRRDLERQKELIIFKGSANEIRNFLQGKKLF